MSIAPFSPGTTSSITVGAASANVLVSSNRNGRQSIRVCNQGSATVWINWGSTSSVAATTSDLPINAGETEILSLAPTGTGNDLYIAAIAAAATGVISFTPGTGN